MRGFLTEHRKLCNSDGWIHTESLDNHRSVENVVEFRPRFSFTVTSGGRIGNGQSFEKENCPMKDTHRYQAKERREDIFRWIELFTFFFCFPLNLKKIVFDRCIGVDL